MNLGIVTSFIIAGMIMLGLVMVNINVQNSSAELTITQITRNHVSSITEMINDDFSNMGYDVDQTTMDNADVGNAILTLARADEISFYRNIADDPTINPDLITWKLMGDDLTSSKNPDDHTLIRITEDFATGTPDTTKIQVGVTNFELLYYNTVGTAKENNVTPPGQLKNSLDEILQVHVILEVQSTEPIYNRASGDGRYVRSVWEKRFTPINLQLN